MDCMNSLFDVLLFGFPFTNFRLDAALGKCGKGDTLFPFFNQERFTLYISQSDSYFFSIRDLETKE